MRQAGFLAGAGLYALEHHINRLEQDHENARHLAEGLSAIDGIDLEPGGAQTNILFVNIKEDIDKLSAHLKAERILITPSRHLRLVTHLDVDQQDIEHTIGAFKAFFK
jgi:threonine aldolase